MRKHRIGLLGGSFNPAHAAHREISLYALKFLNLDQIWWLVSPQNPLKSTHDMAPLAMRIRNAQVIAHHPKIIVTGIEKKLGTLYTIDTLKALKRRFPRTHFIWLMGADNLQQIPYWKNGLDIFYQVPVAVFRRPHYAAGRRVGKAAQRFDRYWMGSKHAHSLLGMSAPAWLVMDNKRNGLSATAIRRSLSLRKDR
jgi:nicotinate-nucleotide adenylyltransferase